MAKKKKVRVAFKKNRQKRTRANDLTQAYGGGDEPPPAPRASPAERVRAKGDLSRHRTVMHEVAEGAERRRPRRRPRRARSSVDLSECRPGRVLRVHGLESVVRDEDDGREVRCGVRRILKTLAIDGRNVVAVGDRVWFRPGGTEPGAHREGRGPHAGRSPAAIATASTSSSPTSTAS